jgi:hypothetical protein
LTDWSTCRYTPPQLGKGHLFPLYDRRWSRRIYANQETEEATHGKHRSSPRWFCGRRRLGGRLQDPEGERPQCQHCPKSNDFIG